MAQPFVLRMLPMRLRQTIYSRLYDQQHSKWHHLYGVSQLALCPQVSMYDLVPGDIISGHIAFNGFYELQLSRVMAKLALRGGLLVDVGANMGYFSVLWAGRHPSARAIAFEAAPRNIKLIQQNITKNGFGDRITLVAKAAGREVGTAYFSVGPEDQTGWGGIAACPAKNTITVPLARLDDELQDVMIEVLKVDVEGADTWVLQGCESLLRKKRIRRIFFERNRLRMERLGIGENEASEFLSELGYACVNFGKGDSGWLAYPKETHIY